MPRSSPSSPSADVTPRDVRWWTEIRTGGESAFESLFRAYAPDLADFAHSYVRDRDAAQEIVHRLFCSLWEQRFTLPNPTTVRGYLFAAARNRARNYLRDERAREAFLTRVAEHDAVGVIVGSVEATDSATLTGDLADTVAKAIVLLPPRCREVFILSRQHGLSNAEAAAVLDIAPKTVEIHLGRALKLLRARLSRVR